jgi:C-terminal processing protease CtpA/Prc
LVVQGLVPGSPAEDCGLIAAGDTLYEIDGKSVYRAGADEVAAVLLGPEGTAVRLGLKRGLRYESDPLFTVILVRCPVLGAGSVEASHGRRR